MNMNTVAKIASVIIETVDIVFDDEEEEDEEEASLRELARSLTTALPPMISSLIPLCMPEIYIPQYSDTDFFQLYRMSKKTFDKLLDTLTPCKDFSTVWTHELESISGRNKLLIALAYLSSQETARQIGDKFNVADSTVSRCINDVIKALNSLVSQFIKWPQHNEQEKVAEDFLKLSNIPGVVGAIDSCHIDAKFPKEAGEKYYNRKMSKTVILQAVCNAEKIITNISVGAPGKCHDARVLTFSNLYKIVEKDGPSVLFKDSNFYLLGDPAYPLKTWLITPFKDTGFLTRDEKKFNVALGRARVVIENVFCLLKSRWRRLLYCNVQSVPQICDVITACCVLHNFCLLANDATTDSVTLENATEDYDASDILREDSTLQCAQAKRNYLMSIV